MYNLVVVVGVVEKNFLYCAFFAFINLYEIRPKKVYVRSKDFLGDYLYNYIKLLKTLWKTS